MVKIIPRTYTGEADDFGNAEDPRTWLNHYEKTCRPNGWADDDDKLMNFVVFLKGEADDWYDINKEWIEHDDRTWEEVKNAFTLRFRPTNYNDEIEERLRTPTQK